MKQPRCAYCGSLGHYATFCMVKPKKPIQRLRRPRQMSAKEVQYQVWKETVARPALIARDGNFCSCCGRHAEGGEKLDIEHTLGKGSHPGLKQDINNLTLMCRFPCHRAKTDRVQCNHDTSSTHNIRNRNTIS